MNEEEARATPATSDTTRVCAHSSPGEHHFPRRAPPSSAGGVSPPPISVVPSSSEPQIPGQQRCWDGAEGGVTARAPGLGAGRGPRIAAAAATVTAGQPLQARGARMATLHHRLPRGSLKTSLLCLPAGAWGVFCILRQGQVGPVRPAPRTGQGQPCQPEGRGRPRRTERVGPLPLATGAREGGRRGERTLKHRGQVWGVYLGTVTSPYPPFFPSRLARSQVTGRGVWPQAGGMQAPSSRCCTSFLFLEKEGPP